MSTTPCNRIGKTGKWPEVLLLWQPLEGSRKALTIL